MMRTTVCFCADRPAPESYVGGGAGVMKLLERYFDPGEINCDVRYLYRDSNKYRFLCDLLKMSKQPEVVFICHEPNSAAFLSALHKKYRLVYHQQGPAVQEYVYLMAGKSRITMSKKEVIEKLAFSGADKVHFPSKGAEKMYFESKFATMTRDKVNVGDTLYNTICLDEHIQSIPEIERRSDCLTFLSVGTMTKLKGQDLSCAYLDRLLRNDRRKIRWITVGKGPMLEELLSKCQSMMERYSTFEHIHFSELSHANVLYLDSIADIYLMLHRSSIFDLATLEAMSNSCMLVLSNIGGNIDLNVEDNCILVNSSDMDESVKMFEKCDVKELKDRNRQVFYRYFSPECFVRQYNELILECISN